MTVRQQNISSFSGITSFLINKSSIITGTIILLSLVLGICARDLKIDSSGFSYDTVDPKALEEYQAFKKNFATDDILILAIQNDRPASDPAIQESLAKLEKRLKKDRRYSQVISIAAFNTDQLKASLGIKKFWTPETIVRIKKILPTTRGLISNDLKTLAIAIELKRIDQNGFIFYRQLQEIQTLVSDIFPGSPTGTPQCHFVGYPVLKAAFERYNLANTAIYIALGLIIGTLAAFYIFKSLRVSLIVAVSCGFATIWTAGLVTACGMELTIMSGISVCFIILVSTTTVMHIVSKYYEMLPVSADPGHALKNALDMVFRPCFMCALTTAAGFASLMISPVKMIQDTGLMIFTGVICAFGIALTTSVFMLKHMAPPKDKIFRKIRTDFMTAFQNSGLSIGIRRPTLSLWSGIILTFVFGVGCLFVQTSTSSLFQVSNHTREAKSIAFFQKELTGPHQFSMVIKPLDGSVTSNRFWVDLSRFEQKIKTLEPVQGIDSLSPTIRFFVGKAPLGGVSTEQIVNLLFTQKETEKIAQSFISKKNRQARIILHVSDAEKTDLRQITRLLEKEAGKTFRNRVEVSFQGLLMLQEQQKTKILAAQLRSLILALGMITVLMILQLGSLTLGLISLIPNVFPLLAMIGLMGFFSIPIDPLVIFAAIISFGLSVDDSIHFLTHLKKEISNTRHIKNIKSHVKKCFKVTARALLSTTIVLFLSTLSFLLSSFSHVFAIGLLLASASAAALYADLVLMVALMLKVGPIERLITISGNSGAIPATGEAQKEG